MADLMESRCGSLPTAQLTPHAEQFLSLLERKGIVPDQEITNEKARSADKALRKNIPDRQSPCRRRRALQYRPMQRER